MPERGQTDSPHSLGVYISLLRGINVGGRHKLPMKELTAMYVEAGCEDVRTYIQSGNVVFRARKALAERIPMVIAKSIAEARGFEVPVVARTGDELEKIAHNNPFLLAGADERRVHVGFLAETPSREAVASLDGDRSPPDAFEVRGTRDLLALAERCGAHEAHEQILRSRARNDEHGPKLADRSQARPNGLRRMIPSPSQNSATRSAQN